MSDDGHFYLAYIYTYTTYTRREKRNEFESAYSPPCVVLTSCWARGVCSRAGCSKLACASWGQVTICQIRPIGHVRCLCVNARVCARVRGCVRARVRTRARARARHECFMHKYNVSPTDLLRDVARHAARIFVRRPEGRTGHTLPATLSPSTAAKRARTWHRFAKCSLRLSPRPRHFPSF